MFVMKRGKNKKLRELRVHVHFKITPFVKAEFREISKKELKLLRKIAHVFF